MSTRHTWKQAIVGTLFAFCVCVGLSACGGSPRPQVPVLPKPAPVEDPAQIVWGFEPQGVRVVLKADPDLNIMGQTPLALTLCIYQLKNRDMFDNKISSAQGVYALLECNVTDPGVAAARREFIQPGEEKIFTTDRAEGAKFLAVVAGFNELQPENAAKAIPMPVHTESTTYIPFIYSKTLYEAGLMDAHISIAPHAVSLTGVERVQ